MRPIISIEKLKAGDESALKDLIDYLVPVIRVMADRTVAGIAPEDADDIAQETILKVYQNLDKFTGNSERFIPWCLIIARNIAFKKFPRYPCRWEVADSDGSGQNEYLADSNQTSISSEQAPHRGEMLEVLQDAILELPPTDRQLVLWRYFEDQPISKIAELLGLSTTTVYSRLSRAGEKMRHALKAKGISS